MRTIAIGSDHGGYQLKCALLGHLKARGLQVIDCGTFSEAACDYPVVAKDVAVRVASGAAEAGIMIDGAGIGSSMAANKVPGVRAALCYDVSSARNSREHNNANLVTLGAGLIGPSLATQIVDVFLDTHCTAERHLRRVAMIDELEHDRAPLHNASDSVSGNACDCQGGSCGCDECQSKTGASGQAGAPRVATSSLENELTELSETDLQRVAERIASMLGTGSVDAACVGPECGFCRPCGPVDPAQLREFIAMGADRIVCRGGGETVPKEIARYIDHTLLRPDSTYEQIDKLCSEAKEYGFASVCVNPFHVKRCAAILRGSPVKVCTVVGFPLGANAAEIKALEARRAIREGAKEIDMVVNVGAVKSGDDEAVYHDIRTVVEACMDGGAICKVILETALLSNEEKTRACVAARRARANFVKTSTGFGPGGATAEDVALMSEAVKGTRMGVKASGGIRTLEDAEQMIRAGATRLGVSAGIRIVQEAKGVTVSSSSGGASSGGDKY
ncbi:MAG: deoxyribose-phosphate aldolase [Planctomycetes bacterium]|nr:deoxyribose-phosphate aldolase [Planctomycetota bacterium]